MAQKNDVNEPASTESSGAAKEELAKELELAKAKCEEYLNGWKRERADFLNYKKDEMERIGELAKYANTEIILKIIPILDNIYLAESHVPSSFGVAQDKEIKNWLDGFLQIKNQLCDFLSKEGIEPIKTEGQEFDPTTMDAVEEITTDNVNPGWVAKEVQRGYKMHGQIIRPAKVKISK